MIIFYHCVITLQIEFCCLRFSFQWAIMVYSFLTIFSVVLRYLLPMSIMIGYYHLPSNTFISLYLLHIRNVFILHFYGYMYRHNICAYNIYNQSSIANARASMSPCTYSCSNTTIDIHYHFKLDCHMSLMVA